MKIKYTFGISLLCVAVKERSAGLSVAWQHLEKVLREKNSLAGCQSLVRLPMVWQHCIEEGSEE